MRPGLKHLRYNDSMNKKRFKSGWMFATYAGFIVVMAAAMFGLSAWTQRPVPAVGYAVLVACLLSLAFHGCELLGVGPAFHRAMYSAGAHWTRRK
jgi:hypothetical protein